MDIVDQLIEMHDNDPYVRETEEKIMALRGQKRYDESDKLRSEAEARGYTVSINSNGIWMSVRR